MFPSFVRAALITGFFIGAIVYCSSHFDPFLVGLLATVPIGIMAFAFIESKDVDKYATGYGYGYIISVGVIFTFLLLIKRTSPLCSYVLALGLWAALVALFLHIQ